MKKVLGTIALFWVLIAFGAETIGEWMFKVSPFISADNSYCSIYFVIVLLSGLIVACTLYIVDEIRKNN